MKPSRGLGGQGITIVPRADLRAALFEGSGPDRRSCEGSVVQAYIHPPALLQWRKFDLRAFCLVARTSPQLWFFAPGYCKVALEPYDIADLDSRFAHLTNAHVQKAHPEYKSRRGAHIWPVAAAEAELGEGVFARVHAEMKRALLVMHDAVKDKLASRRGYFDLLGLDFMLDADLGVHLLEVNSNPAMFFDSSPVLRELVPKLLDATIETVLAAQRDGPVEPVWPFQPLIDASTGFRYSG